MKPLNLPVWTFFLMNKFESCYSVSLNKREAHLAHQFVQTCLTPPPAPLTNLGILNLKWYFLSKWALLIFSNILKHELKSQNW